MILGTKGIALIKGFEELKYEAYLDEGGIPTIGWGHTGWYSPGIAVALGQSCTDGQAEEWFHNDTAEAVRAVNDLVMPVLNQNEFDALVSFSYNVGIHGFAHSTLLRDLNNGLVVVASRQFLRWDYVGKTQSAGLEKRRKAEEQLFLEKM